jgi:DNA-binding GntR family transcriptional regulator
MTKSSLEPSKANGLQAIQLDGEFEPNMSGRGRNQVGGTIRGRAAREIRNRILSGEYEPGMRLDIDALSEEFDISRTPVREAMLELAYDGLVLVAPRRGITVMSTSQASAESWEIVAVLAGKAAEWAALRHDEVQLQEIKACALAMSDMSAHLLVDGNWRFHSAVNRAAGSVPLLAQMRRAMRLIPSNFFERFPDRGDDFHLEHMELVEVLEQRDAQAARRIAELHVIAAGEQEVRRLKGL